MDSRTEAFAACPDTGCDWGSFYLGWKASREALLAAAPAQPQSDVHPLCREQLRVEGKAYPRSGCEVCGKWSPKSDKCRALLGGDHENP